MSRWAFPCIIPSALIVCFPYICILIVLSHIYTCIVLRGGNTTPPSVADAFLSSVSRSTGLCERLLRFSCALRLAHVPELEPDVIPDI
jgi:hypothetical protein